MNWFKEWCKDFPTLGGSAVVAQFLLLVTGLNVNVLMARQKPFPDGYESWFWLIAALSTGTFVALIGKRLSDFRYKAAGKESPTTTETVVTADAVTTTTEPKT